jgi:hypothetical protein
MRRTFVRLHFREKEGDRKEEEKKPGELGFLRLQSAARVWLVCKNISDNRRKAASP